MEDKVQYNYTLVLILNRALSSNLIERNSKSKALHFNSSM